MDSKLGVQHHNGGISKPPPAHGRRGGRQQQGGGGGGNKGIKVVYISSPMMLTASAEEFRAVVQELTGRDSNVADHDLLAHSGSASGGGAPSSSSNNSWSSSSASYSSFGGRASPTATARGPGRPAAEYAAGGLAAPPSSFQGMYDQAGTLLYGQDYW